MKSEAMKSRPASQASASFRASGAGPYSMAWYRSRMFMVRARSCHCVAMSRRIAAGQMVFELTLDVGEQTGRAKAEQVWFQPTTTELLFHQDQPVERGFRRRNAACRFEANLEACTLGIGSDRAGHHH